MTYTRGPWKCNRRAPFGEDYNTDKMRSTLAIDSANWASLAQVVVMVNESPSAEGVANAHLIAAAPDLYEALNLILPLAKGYVAHNNVGSNRRYIKAAEEAINRAQGEL